MKTRTTFTDAIYGVRATHAGEATACYLTRLAVLRLAHVDPRTRSFFESWGHQTGVDPIVEEMAALLDATARRAGVSHRSMLRRQEHAFHLIPILGVMQQREDRYLRLLADTRDERSVSAMRFVVDRLYGATIDADVPMRGWLANDLMSIFDLEVAAHVYGERVQLLVGRGPIVEAGQRRTRNQRPKLNGAHLERDATWYYQLTVQEPRAALEELADTYQRSRLAAGTVVVTKDRDGRTDRPNDSVVRRGAANAKRLLELTVPPEQWTRFLTKRA